MSRISAVLIVRNEEARLENCLASLAGVVDEIAVVDTGSTDRSIEIARDHTARCYDFTWIDDFSAARNFAIDLAAGDYVLQIDADEVVDNPAEAGRLLREFVTRHTPDVVGTVEIINVAGFGTDAQETIDHTERFFCRGRFRYQGAIHEQVTPITGEKRAAPTGLRLRHWGYAQAPDAPDHKAHRNKRILARELSRHPDDEYFLYQLGKAHYSLKEFPEAAAAFEAALRAIRFDPAAPPRGRLGVVSREVLTGVVVSLAYAYVNTNRTADAETLLAEHAALAHAGTDRADFHHVRGYVYLMQGDIARSRAAYLESMRLGATAEDVLGTGSFRSAYHLGLLCEAEQDLPGALEQYRRSLELKPDYNVTLSRCIDLVTEQRLDIPAAIWAACDHDAFTQQYVDRIMRFLDPGDMQNVKRLIQAAAALPELLRPCKRSLEQYLEKEGHRNG